METAGLETSVVMMPAKVQSRATAQGMPRAPSFPLSALSLCLFSSRFPPCSPLSLSLPTLIPLLPPPFLSPTPFFSTPLSLKLHLPSPPSHTNALPSPPARHFTLEGSLWRQARRARGGLLGSSIPRGRRHNDICRCPGTLVYEYSTTPRNENRINENHLGICLSFSQKNRN